jgi:hypothetical protein
MAVLKVRCDNPKSYALTEGTEYDVVKREEGYYFVVNDEGKTARYVEGLFTATQTRPGPQPRTVEAARPAAPAAPPRRTTRNVHDSITVVGNTIRFTDLAGREQVINNVFTLQGSNISCGVGQITNLNGMIREINGKFNLRDDDFVETRKLLMTRAIDAFIKASVNAMVVASTTSDVDEDLLRALDACAAFSSEVRRNPNSGHNIKTWVFYCNGR